MKKNQIQTNSEDHTMKLAEKLASLLKPGDVITLEGDLGAGKTTFTKGIAQGLGVKRVVNSPTFTIIKEYSGELPLYHMDVYRLEDSDEDIGFSDYFDSDGITVVECAHFIVDYLPSDYLNINISYVDDHKRLITFRPHGRHFEHVTSTLIGYI